MIDPHDFSMLLLDRTPRLDLVAAAVASVDRRCLGPDVVQQMLDSMTPDVDSLDALLAHVFGTLGFRGNHEHYYASSNSLIDRVLLRRMGNPLSLAVVTSEIGRRSGQPLNVVGIPGHVILGDPASNRWFDPFAGGRLLDRSDVANLHQRLFPGTALDERAFEPLTAASVAARMLANLRVAGQRAGDRTLMVNALTLRNRLPGVPVNDHLDLANLLMLSGRWEDAAAAHDALVELRPQRAEVHRTAASRCRANLN